MHWLARSDFTLGTIKLVTRAYEKHQIFPLTKAVILTVIMVLFAILCDS